MFRSINLEIETEVLTSGGCAEIVAAILECLLYQRNQIELVYPTFRRFVNEWIANGVRSECSEGFHDYMLDRQREKAIQTKESICAMRQLIADAFDKHDLKSLRFLFGSTISTPKEAYTVHLPVTASSCLHMNEHHRLSKNRLNQLLISLVTHQDLDIAFSKNLCQTNVFLEFEMRQAPNAAVNPLAQTFPSLEKTQLPKSCKDIHFYLERKNPVGFEIDKMICCRRLQIFNGEQPENMTEQSNDLEYSYQEMLDGQVSTWWESEIMIRGFKAKLIKGRSIWKN